MAGEAGSAEKRERALLRPTLVEWLALAASLFLTLQYSWLLDDAFIYFRYVDNLVHLGRGLTFNEGEYVEGFSSPLWCVLLVPLRWVGLDWWLITRIVGLACAAGTWALLVVLARRCAPRGAPIVNLPLAYLAASYAVQTYFTSGVETPLVQLVAAGFALYVVHPDSRAAKVLLGLAPMVRHELALPFAIALAWSWRERRRIDRLPLAIACATLGAWTLFRIGYYADLLPNTFYLKDEVNWPRGLEYLHDTFRTYGTYVLAPGLALLAWCVRRDGEARLGARAVMVVAALAVCVYVAKIGGDPRHYRYLAFPFCVLACAASGLVEHGVRRWPGTPGKLAAAVAGIAVLAGSACLYPRQLSKHPFDRTAEHAKIGEINDAQYHRLKPDLTYSPWTLEPDIEQLDDAMLDLAYGESPLLPQGPVDIRGEYARWRASGERPSDYPLTTQGWCATAWRVFTHTFVHKDGLTDAILARTSAKSWRAAHKKELFPLAADLARLRAKFGSDAGTLRRAVEAGEAPPWVVRNLDALEAISKKSFNRHDFAENLALAFTFVPRIEPGEHPTETVIPGRND